MERAARVQAARPAESRAVITRTIVDSKRGVGTRLVKVDSEVHFRVGKHGHTSEGTGLAEGGLSTVLVRLPWLIRCQIGENEIKALGSAQSVENLRPRASAAQAHTDISAAAAQANAKSSSATGSATHRAGEGEAELLRRSWRRHGLRRGVGATAASTA
jgi:hypothetical protein